MLLLVQFDWASSLFLSNFKQQKSGADFLAIVLNWLIDFCNINTHKKYRTVLFLLFIIIFTVILIKSFSNKLNAFRFLLCFWPVEYSFSAIISHLIYLYTSETKHLSRRSAFSFPSRRNPISSSIIFVFESNPIFHSWNDCIWISETFRYIFWISSTSSLLVFCQFSFSFNVLARFLLLLYFIRWFLNAYQV